MKFGLLYELQMPKPWHERSELEIYHQALEQIALADRLGYDYVWEVEHHFLAEYSHSSAPECFLAAVTQRTEQIRIGQGVALLPYNFNHPVRVAERAAALDILSKGRFDLGTGRSITEAELGGFGIDPGETKAMWREAVAMIPRMWQEEVFSHEGTFFKVPPRSVIPKPVQKPHPPMWVACTQPASFVEAGERGLGSLCFGFSAPADLTSSAEAYRAAIARAEPVGAFVNDQIGASAVMYCAPTRADADEHGYAATLYFISVAAQLFQPWVGKEVRGYEFYTEMTARTLADLAKGVIPRTGMVNPPKNLPELIESGIGIVGTPADCVGVIERYAAVGVDQMVMLVQAGRLPHEKVMASLELFAREVIPHFRRADHGARRPSAGLAS